MKKKISTSIVNKMNFLNDDIVNEILEPFLFYRGSFWTMRHAQNIILPKLLYINLYFALNSELNIYHKIYRRLIKFLV